MRVPARIPALLALAVATGVLGFVILASSAGTYRVTAVFEQAHGLVAGGEVKAGGVNVGEIERIVIEDGLPHVTMEVADDYRLRRGAIADLRLFSNSGELNRYVDLIQGDGPELPDGARLGLADTDQPVEFDQAISALTPRTRRELRAVLDRLNSATRGRGPDVDRALRHSAEALHESADLLDDVSADGRALRTLVRDGRAVVGALASEPGDLSRFADRLAGLLDTTAGRQADLVATAELLAPGLRSPRLALERFDASIPNLLELVRVGRPAIAELVPFSRELRPALAQLRPTLAEARRLTRAAPADLRALTPLLETGEPVFRRLAPTLELANPVLDHLRVRAPELAATVTLWGDMTANYDANGHGARTSVILANGPANPMGPDEDVHDGGYVVRPFDRTPGALEGEPWTDYEDSFVGGGMRPETFLTEEERRAPDQRVGEGGDRAP